MVQGNPNKEEAMKNRRTSLDQLCEFHNMDGDERGWRIDEFGGPAADCPCCRSCGLISPAEMKDFFNRADKHEKEFCTVELNGSILRIFSRSPAGSTQPHFHVELVEGAWPSDAELVDACDSHHPFGGDVHKISAKEVEVVRYTDD